MSGVLDGLSTPEGWSSIPFGRLVSRSRRAGRPDLQPLSVFLDDGVVPRSARADNFNRLGEDMSKYLVVEPGDVVFNKLRTWQGGLGVSRHQGIVSPAYFVCRPEPRVDPRFLHFALRSKPYLAELTRVSKFMPPSQFDILWEDLRSVTVLLPRADQQRAIADFLDTETTRIDTLIARKQQLASSISERFWGTVRSMIRRADPEFIPLRRILTHIADGPFGSSLTSAHYSDDGARVVRLGNVGLAEFRDNDQAFIPLAHYRTMLRHAVRPGDLIVAGLGDEAHHVGRACVAPDLGPAIVKADCFCARLDSSRANSEFIALYLSSPEAASRNSEFGRGATRTRINTSVARELPIPLPAVETQEAIVNAARELRGNTRNLVERLEWQIKLLREHRRALITAAVTGELEVPGVAV